MHTIIGRLIIAASLPLLLFECQGCSQERSAAQSSQDSGAGPDIEKPTVDNEGEESGKGSVGESADESSAQSALDGEADGAPAGGGSGRGGGDGGADLSTAPDHGAATKDRAGGLKGDLSKARALRRSAADDEARGRHDVAYATLLRAWRILRIHEGEPGVDELAGVLRGDLGRLGKTLRSRSRAGDFQLNEKTILVH